ncbi:hypothetical protein PInf_009630 [Phytophthora infestans]|nr:hypothetical protein PInf_009630 [Phytophthora infestans]
MTRKTLVRGNGTGDDGGGGELVCLGLTAAWYSNTVDVLFEGDSEDDESPDSSQNAVGRAFEILKSGASDTMNVTEQTAVIGAFQRLLSETEQDPVSGDESVEKPNDDQECDDPLVLLTKPGGRRGEYDSLRSDSDYGQFSDDDYVEPVRLQQDDDESPDDEGPPVMDTAFIESLGGILPLNQIDKNALRNQTWGATSSVFEEEMSSFRD